MSTVINWLTGFLTAEVWGVAANKALHIGVIFLVAFLALRGSRLLVRRILTPLAERKTFALMGKRALTLASLLQSLIRYTVYAVVTMMLLREFQIDTTSIIAGAGFIGLAVGVGAQSLIKDMVTGFFIIFEDQYGVGDYIVCGDMAGTVEDIGFRITRLRDSNGVLHIIPNGAISRVSNFTRGHLQAVVNVVIPLSAGVDQVLPVLEQTCAEIGRELAGVLKGPPQVLGIVEMKITEVTVRLTADTLPVEQARVERVMRHRIIVALASAGILPPRTPAAGG